jgi:hypothetical protein
MKNQDLKNNPEVKEITVMCINFNCFKSVQIKDAIAGNEAGDFYCSEECRNQDLSMSSYTE